MIEYTASKDPTWMSVYSIIYGYALARLEARSVGQAGGIRGTPEK